MILERLNLWWLVTARHFYRRETSRSTMGELFQIKYEKLWKGRENDTVYSSPCELEPGWLKSFADKIE